MNTIIKMDKDNYILHQEHERWGVEYAIGVHKDEEGISLLQAKNNDIYITKEGIKNLIKLLTKILKEYDNTGKDK